MRQWYTFYSQRITNWHEHSAKMALLNRHQHSDEIEESNFPNTVGTIALVAHSSIPMKVKSKMDTKVRKPNRTPHIANKRTTFRWFSLFLYINQKCGVVLPIFNQISVQRHKKILKHSTSHIKQSNKFAYVQNF